MFHHSGSVLVQLSGFSRNEDASIDDFIDVLEEVGPRLHRIRFKPAHGLLQS